STIWIAVKAINAGIYFLLALGVFRLTRSALSAQANCASGILPLLVVVLYPMWTIMVGYSFAQLAFACAYVWAVYFVQELSEKNSYIYLVLFASCAGYLYWIHPT